MRDRLLLLSGVFFRSSAIGLLKVFLGFYLINREFQVGLGTVISAGLAGILAASLVVGFLADRVGRRRSLAALATANLGALLMLEVLSEPWQVLLVSFLGMINGMGRDRGPSVAIESAALPRIVSPERRTLAFAWYNVAMDVGHSFGALLAGLPSLLGVNPEASFRLNLLIYAGLMGLSVICSLAMSPAVEKVEKVRPGKLTPESRRHLLGFAALSWLDSFGGGFIAGSILSVWFSVTFKTQIETIAILFFAGHLANAVSHYAAAWVAGKIGLINTMVFTHIPSNLFLMAIPFVPNFGWAAILFLAREFLVEMDVPTRQSYLAGIFREEERTVAASAVSVARSLGWASAPLISAAGAAPLLLAGGLKTAYDLALWVSFRKIRPLSVD